MTMFLQNTHSAIISAIPGEGGVVGKERERWKKFLRMGALIGDATVEELDAGSGEPFLSLQPVLLHSRAEPACRQAGGARVAPRESVSARVLLG